MVHADAAASNKFHYSFFCFTDLSSSASEAQALRAEDLETIAGHCIFQ